MSLIKSAILGVSYHKGGFPCDWYDDLPDRLNKHELCILIFEYLITNDFSKLNYAVILLAGDLKTGWARLEKLWVFENLTSH